MTTVNNVGGVTPAYYQPQANNPQTATTAYTGAQTAYAGDAYRASPYTTGYAQGVGAVGSTAVGMTGLANGVGSMTSSMGNIFTTIIDLIANILNTIANLIGKLISGVMGLFGAGKKDKNEGIQGAGGMQAAGGTMPLPNNQGMGVTTPAGTPVPPPPPGTDINQAYGIVDGDLKGVQDPNQGIQIINIHAQKARDYRDKAEQFAKEAEKESRNALYAAQNLQKNPTDSNSLAKLQSSKSKAMELLKTAQEYTKAVYDESLYVQASVDILNSKFQGALGQNGAQMSQETWKNWIGGTTEKQFIFFNKDVKAAPETFMLSMNAVNANIGQATQIIAGLSGAR